MQPEGSWARCSLWLSCTKWKSSLAQGGGGSRRQAGAAQRVQRLWQFTVQLPRRGTKSRCCCKAWKILRHEQHTVSTSKCMCVCVCLCTFYSAFCVIYFYQRFSLSTAARNKFSSLWFSFWPALVLAINPRCSCSCCCSRCCC